MPLFSAERRSSDSESIYPRFKTKYCAWRGNKGTRDPRVQRVASSCYRVQKSTIFFIDATSNHTDRNFSYFRIEYFRKMLELVTERRLHRSFRIMLRIKYLIRFSLLFFFENFIFKIERFNESTLHNKLSFLQRYRRISKNIEEYNYSSSICRTDN